MNQSATCPIPPRDWRRWIRTALMGLGLPLCFAVGFAAIGWALHSRVPPIRARKVSDKIEAFHAGGDAFDTLLVGSSRTAVQIVPSEFDAAMAARGIPTRSFNLGLEGFRPPDDTMVLERALEKRTKPLKFLVVECNPVESVLEKEDRWTSPYIFTHDARRLGVYWRQIWAHERSLDMKIRFTAHLKHVTNYLPEFVVHFRHFVWNECRISRGSQLLLASLTGQPQGEKPRACPPDGFYVKDRPKKILQGAELTRYRRKLAERIALPPGIGHGDRVSQDELLAKKALAERHGATLVLVSAPFLKDWVFTIREADGVIVLDYSDPSRFPELYSPGGRMDFGHLTAAGARIYSRTLADSIAEALKPRTPSP